MACANVMMVRGHDCSVKRNIVSGAVALLLLLLLREREHIVQFLLQASGSTEGK